MMNISLLGLSRVVAEELDQDCGQRGVILGPILRTHPPPCSAEDRVETSKDPEGPHRPPEDYGATCIQMGGARALSGLPF